MKGRDKQLSKLLFGCSWWCSQS